LGEGIFITESFGSVYQGNKDWLLLAGWWWNSGVGRDWYGWFSDILCALRSRPFFCRYQCPGIEQAVLKPVCWFRYVDDTFVIWPHGQETLTEFLNHRNRLHNKIHFTMEIEESHIPFLDIDIYRKTNGSLGHKVYWKPTHTSLYPHQNSPHHPTNS
jgi:hypothetical protein